jgi:hypothetical protein
MPNKLIAAGTSRLRKAADSAVDPAVPAELQQRPPAAGASASADPAPVSSVFAGGRVLSAEDVKGTPEEQLTFVTERLQEIDRLGRTAEDFTVLNKGALLEVAQQRELHLVAGHTNFATWAAGVLDIEPKYVFELLKDAARIRTISALGADLVPHLTRASARKVMADVIADQGVEAAQVVLSEGVARASAEGKRRPTASMLASIAKELTAPSIPPQEARSEISDPPAPSPAPVPSLVALERAAFAVKERVSSPLAPSSVRTAIAADPEAVERHLSALEDEMARAAKRLAAARRAVAATTPDSK